MALNIFSAVSVPWAKSGITYTDPIQGYSANNCSVMAALSSIAFVQSSYLNKPPDASGYCWIPIKKKIFKIRPTVGLGYSAYYLDELWPAVWEKAYGAYLCKFWPPDGSSSLTIQDDDAKWTTPNDFRRLNWETNALKALEIYTGNTGTYRTIKNVDGTERISKEQIINDIKGYSQECGSGSGSWKAVKKMVAWTYYNATAIKTYDEGVQNPYVYNATISANHSYAVLGIVNDTRNDYIVLRNPLNVCPPLPGAPTTWCGTPNILNGVLGRIAVPLNLFHTVFEAYGWI
jgi:hypothetical protein